MIRQCLLFIGLLLSAAWPCAQTDGPVEIGDIGWMDRNYMEQQVAKIETIARTKLGSRLRGDTSDLDTLQRIVDRDLIERDDLSRLQAMGVVLGNVMAAEVPKLQWKVYEDQKGRSRALCVEGARECLFPVTMLSRRIEVGLNPDVRKVYNEALELMDPFLPELPYGNRYRDLN